MKFNKYFTTNETACRCGCGHGSKLGDIDERAIWIATCVRLKFNKPVVITGPCRCPKHNAAEGGADKSRHLPRDKDGNLAPVGMSDALDIKVNGVSPKEVQAFLDDLLAGRHGIGYGKTFTHLDVRPTPARFNY